VQTLAQQTLPPELRSLANHDPHLDFAPPSSMSFDHDGGEIESVEILDTNELPINLITTGVGFCLRFRYRVDRPLAFPKFGCNIGNREGINITSQSAVYQDQNSSIPKTLMPGRWEARFYFYGGLLPGLYFIGGGLFSGHPPTMVHKVRDRCLLRVSASSAQTTFGLCDLTSSPPELVPLAPLTQGDQQSPNGG